ncbi:MAG: hypothetical protein LBT79_07905 [Elusimicrobiota bacterium]|jgi:hypothetical protein|nr:hypothetical protein [Elusimicrobiota bacterium]
MIDTLNSICLVIAVFTSLISLIFLICAFVIAAFFPDLKFKRLEIDWLLLCITKISAMILLPLTVIIFVFSIFRVLKYIS